MRVPPGNWVAPAGSNRSGEGGNDVEAFDGKGSLKRLSERAGRNASERRAGLEKGNVGADPPELRGRPPLRSTRPAPKRPEARAIRLRGPAGVVATACHAQEVDATREAPAVAARDRQPDAREGQAGPRGVAERPVVARKPGNAGGAKGPQFKDNAGSGDGTGGIGDEPTTSRTVQKLQAALHAKAKGAPNYRFYALYDKVYREDVLWHGLPTLPGQRRSAGRRRPDVRGHRGVRRDEVVGRTGGRTQDEDVSAQAGAAGVHSEAGRQAAAAGDSDDQGSRRADGGLLLVLEPIFEADLQPEQYAYRPNRSALDAVQAVRCTADTRHTEVVDADLSGTSTASRTPN